MHVFLHELNKISVIIKLSKYLFVLYLTFIDFLVVIYVLM